jgi:ATP-dependent Lon protease
MKTLLNKNTQEHIPESLPVIPTMDVVVFPQTIVPLLVLDERIINGINHALEASKLVLLLAAKKQVGNQGAIGTKDLYMVGTVATVMRLIKVPEGGIKILVQGICKAHVSSLSTEDDILSASIQRATPTINGEETELIAQIKNIKALSEKMATSGHTFSPDFHIILSKMQTADKIADFILSHLSLPVEQAQDLLETENHKELLEKLYNLMNKEIEVAQMQERIRTRARESMNDSQKEYYLREQLKAIKKELGDDDLEDIEQMYTKLEAIKVDEDIKKEVKRQIGRLERTAPDSMEAGVIRNYLEWIFALPWGKETEDNLDITHAQKVLNEDHYGLKDIKDRILDFISVRNLKQDGYAPIMCFVGPPGTGKTSLGQSIARALGRAFFRISLGGVKDEAEIRGHRRTYVGAMPGRIVQGMKKAGSSNPVIIIDELDKISSDFRGDPSAAMLEVLDPHQNKTFYDNYLGLPFDLSRVLFIATANNLEPISEPLRDRMEIVQLSGYTLDEKMNIAKKYIMPRTINSMGLEGHNIEFSDEFLSNIIINYTQEAGVRQLSRIAQKLCSKGARLLVETGSLPLFKFENVEEYLGPRTFAEDDVDQTDMIGITNGLAWTAYGGEMIKVEAVLMPGKGKLMLTGQLGNVMKESAQAAMSYARAHAKEFGIEDRMFVNYDLHIHVPAGGIPKDGPSAGVTMLTSILSALTHRPINAHYAMTGELNLRGDVMPIGGVKEKILAAKRNKMRHILLPLKNKKDIVGAEDALKDINVIWVAHADEILRHVLLPSENKKRVRH